MKIRPDFIDWTPQQVCDWIASLFNEDTSWIKTDFIRANKICGRKLLLLAADDLVAFGARKVGIQEQILESVDNLRLQLRGSNEETLQNKIFHLACCSRALYFHLVHGRIEETKQPKCADSVIIDGPEENQLEKRKNQDKVLLDTLSFVSEVVDLIQKVAEIISEPPFKDNAELRSMRSLILVLGIELASTAQRDQFVDKPNEYLERSSKGLSDYCDRIIQNTMDPIFIQAL